MGDRASLEAWYATSNDKLRELQKTCYQAIEGDTPLTTIVAAALAYLALATQLPTPHGRTTSNLKTAVITSPYKTMNTPEQPPMSEGLKSRLASMNGVTYEEAMRQAHLNQEQNEKERPGYGLKEIDHDAIQRYLEEEKKISQGTGTEVNSDIPRLRLEPLHAQLGYLKAQWQAEHPDKPLPKGGEHLVYPDIKNGIAIKLTDSGAFGAKGSLAGYLKQSELSNTTFDDHIRIEGFVRLPGEHADRLVITQPWVHGPYPTPKQLSDYMLSKGFQKVFDGAWLGKDDMYVTDVLERNAIVDGSGQVHLIDVLFSFPSGKRLERLENILNARAHGEDL